MKEEPEIELADKNLLAILDIEGNKICNDCGKKDPRWCSINNAVLICSSCARNHKKFNEKISKIKSLEVDVWTEQEINILKLGGNSKFTELIKSYNIPLTKENQEYKYYTKAAQYYRDILIEKSKNNDINNIIKPTLKEGIEILYKDEYSNLFNKNTTQENNINDYLSQINENNNNNSININNTNILNNNNQFNNSHQNYNNNQFNSYKQNNNDNNASWVDKIIEKISPDVGEPPYNYNNENKAKIFFDNFANNMIYAFNDVKERAKDIDFKEKFKIAGEYVQNKTEEIQNSDTFKGIMNTVSTGIDNIIQKTDQFFKSDPNKININQFNSNQNIPLQNNININNNNNLEQKLSTE